MATTVVVDKAVISAVIGVINNKRSMPKKRLVIVDEIDAMINKEVNQSDVKKNTKPMPSIWMQMRGIPKEKPLSIVWEDVEDISEDENDTPEAAEERVKYMRKMKDAIRFQYFDRKLEELQYAGLFMNW